MGGGKPKMMYHFKETLGAFPAEITTEDELKVLVDSLQANKTELYKALVAKKAISMRLVNCFCHAVNSPALSLK